MTDSPQQLFDNKFNEILDKLPTDFTDPSTPEALKAFKVFSEARPPQPEPAPLPDPVPATRWGRAMARTAKILDNETTRTAIKAGGAAAGVIGVVVATIHKDHVLEKQALAQANTPPQR